MIIFIHKMHSSGCITMLHSAAQRIVFVELVLVMICFDVSSGVTESC